MSFNNHEIIKTEVADLTKVNEYTVLVELYEGIDITVDTVIELRDKAISLFNGGKFFSIIDGTQGYATLTNDALTQSANDVKLAEHRMAQAIVVDTLSLSMIANFYLKFKKPLRPVKIFDKMHKATRWLESQKHLLEG
jgi:hypothetical protein